ncbi:hypothetical protein [Longispora urticae]
MKVRTTLDEKTAWELQATELGLTVSDMVRKQRSLHGRLTEELDNGPVTLEVNDKDELVITRPNGEKLILDTGLFRH